MDLIANVNVLNFAKEAGSSAIMIIVIFVLLYMLNRANKKFLDMNEKYCALLEKQIEVNKDLQVAVNQMYKEIFK